MQDALTRTGNWLIQALRWLAPWLLFYASLLLVLTALYFIHETLFGIGLGVVFHLTILNLAALLWWPYAKLHGWDQAAFQKPMGRRTRWFVRGLLAALLALGLYTWVTRDDMNGLALSLALAISLVQADAVRAIRARLNRHFR